MSEGGDELTSNGETAIEYGRSHSVVGITESPN